jgi:hypothetical protein
MGDILILNNMTRNPIKNMEDGLFGGRVPDYILDLLLCSDLDHGQLMTLGAFFYGNYFNFVTTSNILLYCNVHCDKNKVHVLRQLFGMWWRSWYERGRKSYYNVWTGSVFDLNQNTKATFNNSIIPPTPGNLNSP